VEEIISLIKEACELCSSQGYTKAPPNLLYHYCAVNSFYKIIESKKIHVSEALYTNDSAEIIWGKNKAGVIFQDIENQSKGQNLQPALRKMYDSYNLNLDCGSPYIFCLSENGDLLSQWRSYAEDAAGFSIGLTVDTLCKGLNIKFKEQTHLMGGGDPIFVLNPVVYDDQLQDILIRICVKIGLIEVDNGIFDEILPQWELLPFKLYFRRQSTSDGIVNAAINLCHLSFIFKNKGFVEEKEWRIMVTPNRIFPADKILGRYVKSFKVNAGIIKPFMEIDFKDIPGLLGSVMFGPRNKNIVPIVGLFLEQNGFKSIEIKKSIVSYR